MSALKFVVSFYLIYLLLALMGMFIIDYKHLSLYTYIYYFIFLLSLSIGIYIGGKVKFRIKAVFRIDVDKLLKILIVMSASLTLVSWYLMIDYYGSLEYIIFHSFDVRTETIGDGISLVPNIVTYLSSVQYYGFVLSLVSYSINKSKKRLCFIGLFFIVIALSDLKSFGRIGILFAIFAVLSWMFLFKIKLFTFKKVFSVIFLYFMLMLPRMIRGGFDNFSSSIDNYNKAFLFSMPFFLYGPLTVYIYYFSSLYAFDAIVASDLNYAFGIRNFAPIVNVLNGLFHFMDGRVVLIADTVQIPFDYNIYHILGELYLDFGYMGIVVIPLFWGSAIGYSFVMRGLFADVVKIFMMVWVFYSPIYNVYSFGSFFISLIFSYFIFTFYFPSNET